MIARKCLERNVSEYYYGKLGDTNSPKECRYRGYGEDVELKPDDYKDWQVLAARLVFVIVFEVGCRMYLNLYKQ